MIATLPRKCVGVMTFTAVNFIQLKGGGGGEREGSSDKKRNNNKTKKKKLLNEICS